MFARGYFNGTCSTVKLKPQLGLMIFKILVSEIVMKIVEVRALLFKWTIRSFRYESSAVNAHLLQAPQRCNDNEVIVSMGKRKLCTSTEP